MVGGEPLLTIGGCGAQSRSDGRTGEGDHRTTRGCRQLTSIFCKLEVTDRQKLLVLAHRYGLVELTLSTESA